MTVKGYIRTVAYNFVRLFELCQLFTSSLRIMVHISHTICGWYQTVHQKPICIVLIWNKWRYCKFVNVLCSHCDRYIWLKRIQRYNLNYKAESEIGQKPNRWMDVAYRRWRLLLKGLASTLGPAGSGTVAVGRWLEVGNE